ncbi:MAG TPA: hypothetical protein VF551_00925, partial [Chthoniobacterales bacterium]
DVADEREHPQGEGKRRQHRVDRVDRVDRDACSGAHCDCIVARKIAGWRDGASFTPASFAAAMKKPKESAGTQR